MGRVLAAGPLGRGPPSPLQTNAWFLQPGSVAAPETAPWEGRGRHKVQGRSRVKGRRPGSQTGLPGPQSTQRRGEIIINRPGLCFSAMNGLNLCFRDSRIILSNVNTQADKSGRRPCPSVLPVPEIQARPRGQGTRAAGALAFLLYGASSGRAVAGSPWTPPPLPPGLLRPALCPGAITAQAFPVPRSGGPQAGGPGPEHC